MARATSELLCLQHPNLDRSHANMCREWFRLFQVIENMQRFVLAFILAIATPSLLLAETTEEVVSFRCSLAIDAVFAEMDKQAENLVTQEALSQINEKNGEFVCIQTDDSKMFVRLQSKEMKATDNRLVFTIDVKTYRVLKTFYGR
jgi:hypothetical protein